MKSAQKFSIRKRIRSFKYAINGLMIFIAEEHNSRIQIAAAIIVVTISFLLNIDKYEWIAIVLSIGFVLFSEIFNSSVENICDFVSPEKREIIRKIKDLSAAAVLVSSITAAIAGLLIFIPKII